MFDFKGVRIKNIGLFQDQEIRLPPSRLVALVGPNGTGKTTALECLAAAAYRTLDGRNSDTAAQYLNRLAERVPQKAIPEVTGLVRQGKLSIFPYEEESDTLAKYLGLYVEKPMLVRYYPITRGFQHRPDRARLRGLFLHDEAEPFPGPRDLDATAHSLRTPAQHLKQWLVNQYFLRHEPEYGPQHERRFSTFVKALERYFGKLGGRPYLAFERVSRDFEVWFRTPTGSARLEDLAAGVQSLLAIIADLIIHLDATYPDAADSLKEPALVFIDELELHLHPAWQQNAADILLELFPGTRFIISTHSPLVVNDCGAGSILLFHFGHDGQVQVSPFTNSMRGWLAEEIYVRAFGMPTSRNPAVQHQLDEYLVLFRQYLQHRQDGEPGKAAQLQSRLARAEQALLKELPPGDPALEMLRFEELNRAMEGLKDG